MNKIFLFVVFIICAVTSIGQDLNHHSFQSGSESLSSENFHIQVTIGEPIVSMIQSKNTSLNQGFNQSWLKVTPVVDGENDFDLFASPNPSAQIISVNSHSELEINLSIFDTQGSNMKELGIVQLPIDVNLEYFPPGTYFLSGVSKSGTRNAILKVQKIQ